MTKRKSRRAYHLACIVNHEAYEAGIKANAARLAADLATGLDFEAAHALWKQRCKANSEAYAEGLRRA